MSGPVFEAKWDDGIVTRMSVFCTTAEPDLSRAVRLSWHAHDSRTKGRNPTAKIVSAQFEYNGAVLETYKTIDPDKHHKRKKKT